MRDLEGEAWRLWRENHPDNKDITCWDMVPYWEQLAYLHYVEIE